MSIEGEYDASAAGKLLEAARAKHGNEVYLGGFPRMLAAALGIKGVS